MVVIQLLSHKSENQRQPCVDELEWSLTSSFRYLLFSRNARSGIYCQISRNAFCLLFWHLLTMGGDDDYDLMTPHCFYSSRKLHNRCTLYSDAIYIWRKQKFRTVATSKYYCYFTK